MPLQRILVIGSSGTGKSMLAVAAQHVEAA